MVYKKLPTGRLRSYRSMGTWGIGCNIEESNRLVRASIDICLDSGIVVVSTADFATVSNAKMWLTRQVKKMVSELEKWVVKKI